MIADREETTLGDLAILVNQEHAAVCQSRADALAHALCCGDALLRVRDLAPAGGIVAWIDEHFDGSRTCAYNYMRLATYRQEVEAADGIAEALVIVRKLPSLRGLELPEHRARRRRAMLIRQRSAAARDALRYVERAKTAARAGGNISEAFSLLRKCAQILDPAEHDFESREAKKHVRAAYEHLRKAEDEIALALGVS